MVPEDIGRIRNLEDALNLLSEAQERLENARERGTNTTLIRWNINGWTAIKNIREAKKIITQVKEEIQQNPADHIIEF